MTGDSYKTIAFSFRVGETTVSNIIHETCEAIWNKLQPLYMAPPSEENLKEISDQFLLKWQFPNCIGAIDGKHVTIESPNKSGSKFFNYKGFFSEVLLAVVDAQYRFIYVDIGSYGSNSDASIFTGSTLGKRLSNGTYPIPPPSKPPGGDAPLPYVMVGDEAFPLKQYLMRPFPRANIKGESEQVFNYRLSRARRVVENAFGIMAKKFAIFQRPINLSPQHIDTVVQACTVLHNFIMITNENEAGENKGDDTIEVLRDLENIGGQFANEAVDIRSKFTNYFLGAGSVPWQIAHVRKSKDTQ